MNEIASTGGLIEAARKLMDLFEDEIKAADEIRKGNKAFMNAPSLTAMDLQNLTRSGIVARIWKREGRTALAMHPAVVDESAMICNSLSLTTSQHDNDWVNMQITSLQMQYDLSRSQAVSGIRAAVSTYCPEYLSVAPAR
jgi:hypothetical protein